MKHLPVNAADGLTKAETPIMIKGSVQEAIAEEAAEAMNRLRKQRRALLLQKNRSIIGSKPKVFLPQQAGRGYRIELI